MWLAMIVLAAINAFFSLGGLLLFIVGACQKKREVGFFESGIFSVL